MHVQLQQQTPESIGDYERVEELKARISYISLENEEIW